MFVKRDKNNKIIAFSSIKTKNICESVSEEEFATYLQSLDEKNKIEEEILNLKNWFDVDYARKEQKYRRLQSLCIIEEDGVEPSVKLTKLFLEAEEKRRRIQALEKKLIN